MRNRMDANPDLSGKMRVYVRCPKCGRRGSVYLRPEEIRKDTRVRCLDCKTWVRVKPRGTRGNGKSPCAGDRQMCERHGEGVQVIYPHPEPCPLCMEISRLNEECAHLRSSVHSAVNIAALCRSRLKEVDSTLPDLLQALADDNVKLPFKVATGLVRLYDSIGLGQEVEE